ncbi:MAG: hypothetical protein ABJG88_02980 [Litorimonas sp.]
MGATRAETKFEIQDLRKGSAYLDLIGMGIGLIDHALILKQFHGVVKAQVTSWIGGIPDKLDLKEADAQARKIEGLAKAVAESEDGNLTLGYKRETENETEVLMMSKQDGQSMLENFAKVRQQIKEVPTPALDYDKPQRLLLRLYQHNQDPNPQDKKRTLHKAIIRDIDNNLRPLTYLDADVATELENIYTCLRDETNEVLVPEDQRKRAHKAVMDMINVKFDPVKGHFDPNLPQADVKVI